MPTQVLMPALSPTMEKGNLAKWLKKEGDPVKSGDVIAEIETDKATMEVEAVDEGTLGKILIPEGTNDVAVNTPIATILAEGEDPSALKDGKPAEGAPPATEPAREEKAAESAPPAEKDQAAKKAEAPAPAKSGTQKKPGPRPGQNPARQSRHKRKSCPIPTCRKAPRWPPSPCARRFVTRWRKKCAAIRMCSSWARRSPNIKAPTRLRKDCCRNS